MAPIEIDGLPNLIAWWIFPWRTGNVITRWYLNLSGKGNGNLNVGKTLEKAMEKLRTFSRQHVGRIKGTK